MSEVLFRATKYMNVEDTLSAWEEKPRKRPERETNETNIAPSHRGEDLQASPH